jgi:hypothetical protein
MTITDSKCYETTSGTTLSGSVTAVEGDIVLATVTHRSVFTTPEGWTKIYESPVVGSLNSITQRFVFLTKASSGGTENFTATQSVAGRIYINLISVSGVSAIEYIEGSEVYSDAKVVPPYAVPNKPSGEARIWGCSAPMWDTAAPFDVWSTSPADLTLVSLPNTTQARNANFIDLGEGAATGRTITGMLAAGGAAYAIAAVRLVPSYVSAGYAVYEAVDISTITEYGSSEISWEEIVPEDTSVAVLAAVSDAEPDLEDYTVCVSGQPLPGLTAGADLTGLSLWLRIELETEDDMVTPALSNLHIIVRDMADARTLLLKMATFTRFLNVEGALTVEYDNVVGNLAGSGGPVESFLESFVPTDLVQKPNPHSPEHIEITDVEAEGDLIRIYYTDAQNGGEHLEISSITAVGTLTHINDI